LEYNREGVDISALPRERQVEKLTELRTVHDWIIKPQLRTVSGTAEVNSWGGYEKQYQVFKQLHKKNKKLFKTLNG